MNVEPGALTERQAQILEFIRAQIAETGLPPTVREIAAAFAIASSRGVFDHLRALERKGWLTIQKGKSRGLRLTFSPTGIPVVGAVAAGRPILAEEHRSGTLNMEDLFGSGELFAVRVQGDSMIQFGIFDGDYAVVRRQPVVDSGTIGVAYIDGEATVKKIVRTQQGYRLEPGNPDFQPMDITADTPGFQIAGPVMGVVRRLPRT